MKLKHCGPEYSSFNLVSPNCLLEFHRLAIMDLTAKENQPFYHTRPNNLCIYSTANAEFYNHIQVLTLHNIKTKSNYDCEIIIALI